ncbi:hypothetical protein KSS87_020840 [Heliosperma pusillum]|nr:hypothetical protein KSS87_020840 [Heliosperma pusillum]
MYLQSSAGGSSFPIPSGECITGVSSDSTCALSLLSNQTWGSSNGASDTGLGNLMNHGGPPVSQHTSTQTVTVAHLPNIHEADIGLHGASSDHLGPGQFSHPLNSDHLFMEQVHGGRHYMEVDHSNGYSSASASQVHWSL